MAHSDAAPLFSLTIDPLTKTQLSDASKWARFLAIVGMVLLLLMIAFGVFFSTLLSSRMGDLDAEATSGWRSAMGVGMAVVYIIIAVIWFFPLLFLLRFANAMRTALNGNNQDALNASFANLKRCFKYIGIVTIILLVIYAVVLFLALSGSILAGA